MKKILTILALCIALVGIGWYLSGQQKTNTTAPNVVSQEQSIPSASSLAYTPYSKTALENASDKRRVLFFFASWCPTCIPADANFQENMNKIPSDVVLIRVNYNDPDTDQEEKDLARKYGITYQHTFVQIDKDGNEITKWNGGQIDELLANLK